MIYYGKLYYYNTIEYYLMYFFNDTIFIRYLYTVHRQISRFRWNRVITRIYTIIPYTMQKNHRLGIIVDR